MINGAFQQEMIKKQLGTLISISDNDQNLTLDFNLVITLK